MVGLFGLALSPLTTAQTETVTLGPYSVNASTGVVSPALPRNYTTEIDTTYNFTMSTTDMFGEVGVVTAEIHLINECDGVSVNTLADLGVTDTDNTLPTLAFSWTPTAADQGMSYTLCLDAGITTGTSGMLYPITFRVPHPAPRAVGTGAISVPLIDSGTTHALATASAFSYMGDDLMYSAEVMASEPAGVVTVPAGSNTTGAFVVRAERAGTATVRVTARDSVGDGRTAFQDYAITVRAACLAGETRNASGNCVAPPSPPATASGGGGSGGVVALAVIGAGAYYWWKKRQIASGNAAKMAFLPDVDFDLARNDRRAFYTRMNWKNRSHSNWQLRTNLVLHTKYSGKLLDLNANSHIGYRLNGKFGDFNPYMNAKFVANDPENAEMRKTYSFGLNFALPKRFSVQILQPDSEIRRFSLKTQWHLPKNISLQLNQPNSDLKNYGFGVQWHGDSKIRYGISGETGGNSYRLSGQFWF